MTDAQFAAHSPRCALRREREAQAAEEDAVAMRPAHFRFPVPPDRGQQRVVMHDIMRRPPHKKPPKTAQVATLSRINKMLTSLRKSGLHPSATAAYLSLPCTACVPAGWPLPSQNHIKLQAVCGSICGSLIFPIFRTALLLALCRVMRSCCRGVPAMLQYRC